jgi:L-aminopeptidase/D-esterase-like protein
MALACTIVYACAAASQSNTVVAERADQSKLPITVNAGDSVLRFDWPDLQIGTGEYEDGPTGVTVIHFKHPALAAVDVRGGSPGTVDTDFLRLGYETPELDAIVFSGGSTYGLESVTAVNSALKDDGVRDSNWNNVAFSTGAIIYDFGDRRLNEIYPDKRLAQAALRAERAGVFALGEHGAGRSALSGGIFGCNAHSGQGAAYRMIGEVKVAAFVVVNSWGVVTTRDGHLASCNLDSAWPKAITVADLVAGLVRDLEAGVPTPWLAGAGNSRHNTTISLIVISKKVAPSDLQRLAVQVHQSMARAIQPFATRYDGDVLYAVSTEEYVAPLPEPPFADAALGVAAAETMWDAILASVPDAPLPPRFSDHSIAASADVKRFVGDYVFSPIARLRISSEGDNLFAEATGSRRIYAIHVGARTQLQPISGTEFGISGRYPLVLSFEQSGRLIVNPGPWQQVGLRQGR